MRKSTKEILTLCIAVVGAITGIASLSWNIYSNLTEKKEVLRILFVPHVDDAAVICPTVYITNMSRGDVYVSDVQIKLHPPPSEGVWLMDKIYVAPAETFLSWSAESINSSPEPLKQPIKPKQQRTLVLTRVHYKSDEAFRADFVKKAVKVIVTTTTGEKFECGISDSERTVTEQLIKSKLAGAKKPN